MPEQEMNVEVDRLVIEVPEGDATPQEELDELARRAIEAYAERLMREE